MKSQFKIIFIITFLSSVYSCTERIDINTKAGESKLSVFGYITNDTTRHIIKITRTAPYFSTNAPEGISNAVVTISDESNIYTLTESMDYPGVYFTQKNVYGEEGETYTLDILLDFDGDGVNEHYQAVAKMPYATRVDSLGLQPSKDMEYLPELLLYGLIPDLQKNYLALYITKNKIPETILDYYLIISDGYFKGYEIIGYEIPFVVEDGVAQGDTVLFRVSSFSKEFSDFISHARSESGGSNPIFGGPPADVKSNIYAMDTENTVGIVGAFGAFPFNEAYIISDKDYIFPGQR